MRRRKEKCTWVSINVTLVIGGDGREIARVRDDPPGRHRKIPGCPSALSRRRYYNLTAVGTDGRSERRSEEHGDDGDSDLSWDDPATWTGALDRCLCGTGTCAKMAVLHAKGELPLHQDFRHQGILGNIYTGRLVEEARIGDQSAVVPTLSGTSWISGLNTLVLDMTTPSPKVSPSVTSGLKERRATHHPRR
ncbi:proline racemase protein (plasmid) [Rhizobium phaseoli]|nr:proline racemase protein [Rhizobium phaseoli]ANL62984.1 proline racemase protein [Rhizobium phaseoli]ANM08170.1 proline racemase protein [Rhizobium phaseoli]